MSSVRNGSGRLIKDEDGSLFSETANRFSPEAFGSRGVAAARRHGSLLFSSHSTAEPPHVLRTLVRLPARICGLLAIPGPTILLVISMRSATAARSRGDRGWCGSWRFHRNDGVDARPRRSACNLAAIFTRAEVGRRRLSRLLGIKLWRRRSATTRSTLETTPAERPCGSSFTPIAVTALNPKSILFFVAFLPQFLDLSRPLFAQMAIFETTFLILATINAALYAWLAAAAGSTIRKPECPGASSMRSVVRCSSAPAC